MVMKHIFLGWCAGIILLMTTGPGAAKEGKVKVTWLGHAAFRIVSPGGKIIYIDPWLENPKAPPEVKKVEKADLILLTHGHFDHVGAAIEIAKKTGAKIAAIYELGDYVVSQGVPEGRVIEMNKGGTVAPWGDSTVRVTMVHADHSSGTKADEGMVYTGEPVGYKVTVESGFTFYHSGDTALFSDMKLIGEGRRIDLALLPIGGHYTMGPEDAARAVEFLRAKAVIPMHFGTFPVLTGDPKELCTRVPRGVECIMLKPGESKEF